MKINKLPSDIKYGKRETGVGGGTITETPPKDITVYGGDMSFQCQNCKSGLYNIIFEDIVRFYIFKNKGSCKHCNGDLNWEKIASNTLEENIKRLISVGISSPGTFQTWALCELLSTYGAKCSSPRFEPPLNKNFFQIKCSEIFPFIPKDALILSLELSYTHIEKYSIANKPFLSKFPCSADTPIYIQKHAKEETILELPDNIPHSLNLVWCPKKDIAFFETLMGAMTAALKKDISFATLLLHNSIEIALDHLLRTTLKTVLKNEKSKKFIKRFTFLDKFTYILPLALKEVLGKREIPKNYRKAINSLSDKRNSFAHGKALEEELEDFKKELAAALFVCSYLHVLEDHLSNN
ncbi:MAG: hypothetical protein ACTSXQ_06685 [Alphaproteobacteria bacterium]